MPQLQTQGCAPPARSSVNGQPDYYLAPVAPGADSEPFFASDYFDQLYAYALELIKRGNAYVCDLSAEETEKYRGAPDKPGQDSPFRNRSVAENLDLFQRMKAGEFPDGARSLRSKIDMASPNMWLRDPLLYRIRHTAHHQTGDKWCIYPLYDYAHCLSDYLEGITHSICTLEFVDHRPLYDWVLESLDLPRALPHQYEFAKLIPNYIIVSKRKLLQLVQEKRVSGWDDPRMPTLSGLRRRGIPASAIRNFVIGVGVTKFNSITEIAVFEHAIREELNATAQRRFGVLRPLKLVLTNIAAGESVPCAATNNPQDENPSTRPLSLTREVFIESDDFAEVPPPKYFRLKPGGEVRLKYACIIKLDEIVKDGAGAITELRCTADLTTRSGQPNSDKKVKGTIHWVSATKCLDAEVRLYDRLFTVAEPAAEEDFLKVVNPNSLEVVTAKPRSLARPRQTRPIASSSNASATSRWTQEQHARQTGLQPHDLAQGHLGEAVPPRWTNCCSTTTETRVPGSLIEKEITTPGLRIPIRCFATRPCLTDTGVGRNPARYESLREKFRLQRRRRGCEVATSNSFPPLSSVPVAGCVLLVAAWWALKFSPPALLLSSRPCYPAKPAPRNPATPICWLVKRSPLRPRPSHLCRLAAVWPYCQLRSEIRSALQMEADLSEKADVVIRPRMR